MKIKPAKQTGQVVVELSTSEPRRPSKRTDQKSRATSPFKLKKILVPIDFSSCSKKALQYAIPFARKFNARLILLHVFQDDNTTGWWITVAVANDKPLIEGDWQKNIEMQLTTMVQETVPSEIPVEIEVRQGVPFMKIVNVAKEMDVDFIVMSTNGHAGWIHGGYLGSVAREVVQFAPCPVLVVREHALKFFQNQSNLFNTSQDQVLVTHAA